MKPRRISVVIPAYNAAAYLGSAIESALEQTLPPAEILVVDDGSKDQTPAVTRTYGTRVRYLRQDNSGPAAARNNGVREASGDWIAFLDADDFWFPNKLAVQAAALDSLSGPALLCASIIPFDGTAPAQPAVPSDVPVETLTLDRLLRRNRIVTSTVLVPREAILQAGGFDPRYRGPEDFALWLRLAANGLPVRLQRTPLAGYRIVPGSLSQQALRMRDQELQIIRDACRNPGHKLPGRLQAESIAGAHFRAGVALAEAGQRNAALKEVFDSAVRWPFGLTEYSRNTFLVRWRLLRRILMQASCQAPTDGRK